MTATLRWNRLTIAADTEAEFIEAVTEFFPQLLELPYDELEMDITQSRDLTEDAFRSIALKLISGEAGDKKILIRIPPAIERYFRHSSLYRVVDVDIVSRMKADQKDKYTREIIRRNIETGVYNRETEDEETATATNRTALELSHTDVARKMAEKTAEAAAEPEAALVETGVLEPIDAAKHDTATGSTGTPATSGRKKPAKAGKGGCWLLDIDSGTRYPVGDGVTVGREPPADVIYQIPTISKKHFRIVKQGDQWVIDDLRSTNGTYLNGLPVHEQVPLREGDEIVVAITLKHPKGARVFQFTTRPE